MPLSKRAAAEFVRNFLAGVRRLRQRCAVRRFSPTGHRFSGRCTRLWPHRADHGFRHRPYFRLSPQPRGVGGFDGGRALSGKDLPAYVVAQVLGGMVGAGVLYVIASGKPGFELARIRLQRLRRALPRRLLAESVPGGRSRADLHVPDDHSGLYRPPRAARLRARRHRPGPDADPPDRNSGDESFGESGAQHRSGAVCRAGAVPQLWLFWLAPIVGAAIAGIAYPMVAGSDEPVEALQAAAKAA